MAAEQEVVIYPESRTANSELRIANKVDFAKNGTWTPQNAANCRIS
jgi:hypothetical protein